MVSSKYITTEVLEESGNRSCISKDFSSRIMWKKKKRL